MGSQVSGDKVEANVGGNLNIESLQETQTYKEKSSSAGISLSTSGVSGSASSGKMNSDYASVTDQAGIYAGNQGYDINVKGNTDLKGAVIDSTASANKNSLTTGTITFSDIENKAEYNTSGFGFSYDGAVTKDSQSKLGDKGFIPNIPMSSGDDKSSTTKSGVAAGTITITGKQQQDISTLNRNTADTLNKLDQIFDKDTIQEKQEMAALFGELAYNSIHGATLKPGERAAAHVLIGVIAADLANSKSPVSSAFSAGINELVVQALTKDEDSKKYYEKHPEQLQWISAAVGAAVSGMTGGSITGGASIAASGTKNNDFLDRGQTIKVNGEWWVRGGAEDDKDLWLENPPLEGTVFYTSPENYWVLGADGKEYYRGEGYEPNTDKSDADYNQPTENNEIGRNEKVTDGMERNDASIVSGQDLLLMLLHAAHS